MAPNTALCFSLTGIALLIAARFSERFRILASLGALVLVLGTMAFVGYLSGTSTAYGWGRMTRMAVHTSAGLIVLGVGIVALAWRTGTAGEAEPTENPARSRWKIVAASVAIMTAVALLVGLQVFRELYAMELDERRSSLSALVRNRGEFIAAVADFDAIHSLQDHPMGAEAATMSQILAAHARYPRFGETGELVLAKRDGDEISFFVSGQLDTGGTVTHVVPFDSDRAEPMRRALSGDSGTALALDYRGESVLAAYRPVGPYGWGLVGKVDLAEIRSPFLKMALLGGGFAVVLIALGTLAILLTVDPTIRQAQRAAEMRGEITERKLNEETLLRSAEALESTAEILHTLDYPIVRIHPDNRIEFVNNGFTVYARVPMPQYPARHAATERRAARIDVDVLSYLRESDHKRFEELKDNAREKRLNRVTGTSVGATDELTFVAEDGARIPMLLSLTYSAKRDMFQLNFVDITERNQAEEELRRTAEVLESTTDILYTLDYPIVRIHVDNRIEFVNNGFLEYARMPHVSDADAAGQRTDCIGANMLSYLPESEYERFQRLKADAKVKRQNLDTGFRVGASDEFTFLANDGTRTPMLLSLTYSISRDMFQLSFVDITELKQAEEELRRSHEKTEEATRRSGELLARSDILNSLNSPIARVLPDNSLEYVNNSFLEYALDSYPQEAVAEARAAFVGKDILACFPEDERDRVRTMTKAARARRIGRIPGQSIRVGVEREVTFLSENGTRTPVLLSVSYAMTYDRYQFAFTDISHLKRVEASNEDLEQFAYVASHDLQEPLRLVSNYTQLLERRYKDQLDDDAREFIGFAVDGASRMQRLIQDLLTFSRVSSSGRELAPVDSQSAFTGALANLQTTVEEADARVTADDLPTVRADRSQLTMLFQNLIGNAVKFRGEASPRVHVSAEREDGYWRFTVQDNGIGIDSKHADRIFLVFQRLHAAGEYPGTGIGLALCKKIVERHGGEMGVESEPGEGSSFTFTLPAADEDEVV